MLDSVSVALEIARAQRLVLSRADMTAAGLTRHEIDSLVQKGVLIRRHEGVYSVVAELEYDQRVRAAVTATAGAGFARTAARIYGVRGNSTFEEVHVVTNQLHIERLRGVRIHRTTLLEPVDLRIVDGITLTRPERTLCDLCGVLPEWRAASAFEDAILKGLTTHERVATYFTRFAKRGRRGSAAMRRILDARDPSWRPTESGLEDKWCHVLAVRGIELTEPQIELECPGEGRCRIDRGQRDIKLAVEINSQLFHSTREDLERDQRKRRILRLLGWELLEYSEFDLDERPDWVANDYLEAVRRRTLSHGAACGGTMRQSS